MEVCEMDWNHTTSFTKFQWYCCPFLQFKLYSKNELRRGCHFIIASDSVNTFKYILLSESEMSFFFHALKHEKSGAKLCANVRMYKAHVAFREQC